MYIKFDNISYSNKLTEKINYFCHVFIKTAFTNTFVFKTASFKCIYRGSKDCFRVFSQSNMTIVIVLSEISGGGLISLLFATGTQRTTKLASDRSLITLLWLILSCSRPVHTYSDLFSANCRHFRSKLTIGIMIAFTTSTTSLMQIASFKPTVVDKNSNTCIQSDIAWYRVIYK